MSENVGAAADNDRAQRTGSLGANAVAPPTSSTTTTTTATATKEKRSWFHSLTRRKKSPSQTSLAAVIAASTSSSNAADQSDSTVDATQLQSNNNNEPLQFPGLAQIRPPEDAIPSGSSRKRKDEKNVFQRFRKKMGLRFNSLRQRQHTSGDDASGTTDASAEFLTQSPVRGGINGYGEPSLNFRFTSRMSAAALDEPEMVSFTHDYKRFIVKKWLQSTATDDGAAAASPNRVMYKACSEMLSQVWYWGEISRRDAQKQLTDKPTGSFLVRDSETSGCQFTLSFRILKATLHYRLEYRDNYWHFEELEYESIVEMIEDILYRCTNDNFVCFVKVPNEMQPPFPVILKYPLSRYLRMPPLQDLCRRVIQRHASAEEIAKLPIPPPLLEYLSEKRELVFQS